MRTGKVQLESIHAGILHDSSQFLPAVLAVLFHDRGDEHVVGILFFDLTELREPNVDWAVRDQLDIFKAYDLAVIARTQFAVARHHIDDFAGLEADSFRYRATPAGVV